MSETRDKIRGARGKFVRGRQGSPERRLLLLLLLLAGNPVLLTDFEKDVPWCSALQQLMEKESFRGYPEGKIFFPASEEDGAEAEHLPIPPSFSLYLCTELPLQSLVAGKKETDQDYPNCCHGIWVGLGVRMRRWTVA